MTERDEILEIISDLSKEAYGFRMRKDYAGMSDAQLKVEFEELKVLAADAAALEEAREEAARAEWEAHITHLISRGAGDRATAIRWDMDAMGAGDDVGYYCHLCGLSYAQEAGISTYLRVQDERRTS